MSSLHSLEPELPSPSDTRAEQRHRQLQDQSDALVHIEFPPQCAERIRQLVEHCSQVASNMEEEGKQQIDAFPHDHALAADGNDGQSIAVTYLHLKQMIRLWNDSAKDRGGDPQQPVSMGELLAHGCRVSVHQQQAKAQPINKGVLARARQSADFIIRTQMLRKRLEDRTYAKMIGLPPSQSGGGGTGGAHEERNPFLSMRGQMTIGLDIVVTMFTMFVVFYVGSSYLLWSIPEEYRFGVQLGCGLAGLVLGLLIDMILFVIRAERNEQMVKRKSEVRSEASGAIITERSSQRVVRKVTTSSGMNKIKQE